MKNQKPKTSEPPVRVTVIAAVILAAIVGLMLPFLANHQTVPVSPTAQVASTPNVAPSVSSAGNLGLGVLVATKPSPTAEADQISVSTENGAAGENPAPANPQNMNDEYAAARVDELRDLAMTGNLSSLTTIESELNDPDRRIRNAAVAATIQFGDPSAIPALQTAMARTEDPQEKINLQRAVEVLALPSMTDLAVNHANDQQ